MIHFPLSRAQNGASLSDTLLRGESAWTEGRPKGIDLQDETLNVRTEFRWSEFQPPNCLRL